MAKQNPPKSILDTPPPKYPKGLDSICTDALHVEALLYQLKADASENKKFEVLPWKKSVFLERVAPAVDSAARVRRFAERLHRFSNYWQRAMAEHEGKAKKKGKRHA